MKFSDLFTQYTSDELLAQSVSDFLTAKSEKALDLSEEITYVINNHDNPDYVRPELSGSIAYSLSADEVYSINPDDLLTALENDADEFVDSNHSVRVVTDELLEQLANSLTVGRIACSAIELVRRCGAESAATLISSFTNILKLKVGELTDTLSNVANDMLQVITSVGASVGDRIKSILSYLGLFNINTDPDTPIGLPDCRLQDVSGMNVYQAWFAEVPKNIQEFFAWLRSAASRLVKLLRSVTEVIIGSSAFRTISKFINVLTMEGDCFDYTSGETADMSVSNGGFNWKYLGEYPHLTNMQDVIANLLDLWLGDNTTYPDIISAAQSLVSQLSAIYDGSWPSGLFFDRLQQLQLPMFPQWLADIDYTHVLADTSSFTLFDCMCWLYVNIAGRYYGSVSSSYIGCFDMLSYALGAYLDFNHVDGVDNLTKHLSTTSYVKVELPASTLYFWLVGQQVICTRRVYAYSYEKDPFLTAQAITELVRNSTYDAQGIHHFWNMKAAADLVTRYRSRLSEAKVITTDANMAASVAESNYIDALYLAMLYVLDYNGLTFEDDVEDMRYLTIPPELLVDEEVGMGYDSFFMVYAFLPVLTGLNFTEHNNLLDKALANDPSNNFTNLDFAKLCGAWYMDDLGYANISTILDSAWGRTTGINPCAPIFILFEALDDDDYYLPYAHVDSISQGFYSIITDSALAAILSTTLKVIAAVAAVVFIAVKLKNLKRKALAMRTKADARAWSLVERDAYTDAEIRLQYKLYKRADRCELIANAVYRAVPSLTKQAVSGMANLTSGFVQKMTTVLSGSDDGVSTITTKDVKNLSDTILRKITGE